MSSRGQFVIPVTDLDLDGRRLEAPIPAEWLRSALEGSELTPVEMPGAPARVDVHASRVGEDILVRGTVRAPLEVPCARCLDPIRFDPQIELSLLFSRKGGGTPRSGGAQGGARAAHSSGAPRAADRGRPRRRGPVKKTEDDEGQELSSEDAEHESYDGEQIVLDPFLREAILLEAPNFPLCSEACEGIRPRSDEGQARSASGAEPGQGELDPRLSPLLELAKRRPSHS